MVNRLLALLTTGLLLALAPLSASRASGPLVLSDPALSATHVAFSHAGQIWTVPREGGRATRIVTGQSANHHPVYSPDGTFDETFLSNFTSINLVDPIARTPGVGSTMIVGQRERRGVACLGVKCHGTQTDGFERLGHVGVHFSRRREIPGHNTQ